MTASNSDDAGLAERRQPDRKDERLRPISREPLVLETPEHLLSQATTPAPLFFVRNNGTIPPPCPDPDTWVLEIGGEVETPLRLTLGEIRQRFTPVTHHLVLECAGNGRTFFTPKVEGTPWHNGGAGCAAWTGVALGDVLALAGLKATALHTAHHGADTRADGSGPALSRGMPIAKALDPHTMLVWAMNGEPLPLHHGGPLRLVVPGWAGSLSQKWLTRIDLKPVEHDGPGMRGTSYRVPVEPVEPGTMSEGTGFRTLERLPVRAIITSLADGATVSAGQPVSLSGFAWAGEHDIAAVDISADNGASWLAANLGALRNRFDWTPWSAQLPGLPPGETELMVRAQDEAGNFQPREPDNWNPGGYAGNAVHRVSIVVS